MRFFLLPTHTLRGSFEPWPRVELGSFPILYETSCRWTTKAYVKGTGPITGPAAGRAARCGPTDCYPLITATGASSVTIFTRSVWLAMTSSMFL